MLRGASKGRQEQIIILAHQTAVFQSLAYAGKLKSSPEHYLRKMKKAAPVKGDATVLLTPDERAQLRKMKKGRSDG